LKPGHLPVQTQNMKLTFLFSVTVNTIMLREMVDNSNI